MELKEAFRLALERYPGSLVDQVTGSLFRMSQHDTSPNDMMLIEYRKGAKHPIAHYAFTCNKQDIALSGDMKAVDKAVVLEPVPAVEPNAAHEYLAHDPLFHAQAVFPPPSNPVLTTPTTEQLSVSLPHTPNTVAKAFTPSDTHIKAGLSVPVRNSVISTIYIAGPISGMPEKNRDAFYLAEERWKLEGWTVVNPRRLDDIAGNEDLPWEFYLRRDIKLLADCHAIALLEGWVNSRGVRLIEIPIARGLSMPAFNAAAPFPVSTPKDLMIEKAILWRTINKIMSEIPL